MQVKVDSSDIVEKEAKRLEVVKRRQERELAQMVQYELMRKELQVFNTMCYSLLVNRGSPEISLLLIEMNLLTRMRWSKALQTRCLPWKAYKYAHLID